MSMAINLQGFQNKEIYKFKRSLVWDIFGSKCSPPRLCGYDLTYGERDGGFLYLSEEELVGGFSIQTPSDNALRDLYAVARQVPSAINYDSAFFVAKAAYLDGIPDWLPPALPKPIRVVHSADQLIQYLSEG
jgi:hypothetical protein